METEASGDTRQDALAVEPEETLLIRPHLVHVDMGEPGGGEAGERFDVDVWVRAAQHGGSNRILGYGRGDLLEVFGARQIGEGGAAEGTVRPGGDSDGPSLRFGRCPAHVQLGHPGLAGAARG